MDAQSATLHGWSTPWVSTGIFSEGEKILQGEKFEIEDTGTNKGADYKNRTAKSVNILLCFTFLRSF